MRKRLGVLLAALFYYSGLVGLFRWLARSSGQRLMILNYHRASGGDLCRHMMYLRRHYRILPIEDALEEIYACDGKKIQRRDRRTPLVLTFDDGYHDCYTHAFKLACQLQVPITIFLIPGYIESGNIFWWEEGNHLVACTQVDQVTLDQCTYHLTQPDQRAALAQMIQHRLSATRSIKERETLLAAMRRGLGVPGKLAGDITKEAINRSLTWEEIDMMWESGWVSFGAHTMNHPVLSHLADPAELRYEVQACRAVLEQRLGCPIRTFAYPVGKPENIGDQTIKAVREAGFVWAVTTTCGDVTPQSEPLRLERLLTDVSRHWLVLAAETSGIWKFFSPVWKRVIGP